MSIRRFRAIPGLDKHLSTRLSCRALMTLFSVVAQANPAERLMTASTYGSDQSKQRCNTIAYSLTIHVVATVVLLNRHATSWIGTPLCDALQLSLRLLLLIEIIVSAALQKSHPVFVLSARLAGVVNHWLTRHTELRTTSIAIECLFAVPNKVATSTRRIQTVSEIWIVGKVAPEGLVKIPAQVSAAFDGDTKLSYLK